MAVRSKKNEKPANKTSQRILKAAFKCVSKKGYANVSLRDVAEEAGVALSQLNYYYGNREQLFGSVLRAMTYEYVSELETRMASFDTPEDKVQCLIKYNQEMLLNKKERNKVLLDFFGLAIWSKSFKNEMIHFLNNISHTIESQLHLEKTPSSLSPASLTTVIMGTSIGLLTLHQVGSDPEEVSSGFALLQAIGRTIEKDKPDGK